jgi:hypothetical protein
MSERAVRKCRYVLYVISAPTLLREEILSAASQTIITLICEIVLNISLNNLDGGDFASKYKSDIKLLLRKTQSVKKKRASILQCSDNFFIDLGNILKKYA